MNYEYINKANTASELGLYFNTNEAQLLHYFEPELGLFVVESPMVIERALYAEYEPVSFVMLDSLADKYCEQFGILDKDIPVYVGDYDTIAGLTGVNITRGVLALFKRKALLSIPELIKDYHRIAVFDDVENPTNVGAMFRSAAALGIEAVILTSSSADPLYRRASRVSVGTVFQIPWTKLNKKSANASAYIEELHKLSFKTAAMALTDNSININDPRLKSEERMAIIMGNEGFGLSDKVLSESDYTVKIPMKHNVDSLNVAAASSIVFWELTK
jgi:rRNA methylases